MSDVKPPVAVSLAWDGSLAFTGRAGHFAVPIDGASATAPSPMQYLALALAGCMAVDLVHILTRGRHAVGSLGAALTGDRSTVEPRRFTRVGLHFTLVTDAAPAVVDRAIRLSREKYCSVWGSFRQDTALEVTYEIKGS